MYLMIFVMYLIVLNLFGYSKKGIRKLFVIYGSIVFGGGWGGVRVVRFMEWGCLIC